MGILDDNTPAREPSTPDGIRRFVKRTSRRRKFIIGFIALLLLTGSGSTVAYLYKHNQELKKENQRLSNPEEVAKQQKDSVINQVSALVQVPSGETPTVASVSDVSKLKDQVFFADAQNGDKVVIYTQAKKAYLYRPSTNKIINIAPVNIGAGSKGTTTQ